MINEPLNLVFPDLTELDQAGTVIIEDFEPLIDIPEEYIANITDFDEIDRQELTNIKLEPIN